MDPPPPELDAVLVPHLAKVAPLMVPPPGGGLAIYYLEVNGVSCDGEGAVVTTGDGAFVGPHIAHPAVHAGLCAAYPHHAPTLGETLKGLVEAQKDGAGLVGKVLVVSCTIDRPDADGNPCKRTHHVVRTPA